MDLKESDTLQNLKDAFAGESQANRRYLYFAAKADVEGYNDVAAVFRSTAEGETCQVNNDGSDSTKVGCVGQSYVDYNARGNARIDGVTALFEDSITSRRRQVVS